MIFTLKQLQKSVVESTYTTTTLEIDKTDNKKPPKRVLYFSDGVLEEYSSDDSEEEMSPVVTKVDPSMLTWTPWCFYYMTLAARKSLSAAEFCGEKLAWFFGITTPKYGYAIDEYKRMEKEIELERTRDQRLYDESQGLSAISVQVFDGKKQITTDLSETEHPYSKNATEKY